MYNGIGLQTARGTGTNGYVQANLSHLLLSRKRIEYNAEDDIKRAEAALNRKANEELLDHQRKRQIEMKCAEFEMLMENKGFDADDIEKKVSDYRRLLLSQLESGELNVDDEISTKDTHARQRFAAQKREQWKEALGIKGDFLPGSSMQNMNKNDPLASDDEKTKEEKARAEAEEKRMKSLVKLANKERKKKEKAAKKKKLAKKAAKKKKAASSSSSSSSSDSSDSSDSDSDDSSTSSSSDSDREERKRRKAKSKKEMLKKRKTARKRARDSSSEDEEVKKERPEKKKGRGDEEKKKKRGSSEEKEKDRRRRDSPEKVKEEPPSPGRENSPYVDSDLDEETRKRMKSTVSVIRK